MRKDLVSVIVPVYNTAEYLPECLDHILAQSYGNMEVILVDDGSTDASPQICDEYAQQDGRIRVIHQKNQGVSAARNAGLDIAVGDFVFFADSDDLVPQNALERMVPVLADHPRQELVFGGYLQMDPQGEEIDRAMGISRSELSVAEFLLLLFDEKQKMYHGFLWNKLFRRSLIEEHQLRFATELCYNEDRLFIVEYLIHSQVIGSIPDVVYQYRIHSNSAQGQLSVVFKPAMLTELTAFERMKALLKEANPQVYLLISRLLYEKSLYWLRRIPKENKAARRAIREMIWSNARICLQMPNQGVR